MEDENTHFHSERHGTPERDKARHSLTIPEAAELFAKLGAARSKRSVQRFCEQGYLDCVRIKGPRGDHFFINRQSVERYAEELKQIEAVGALGVEARHDAFERATARDSAPQHDSAPAPAPEPEVQEAKDDEKNEAIKLLEDEILNLRIDNRAKEQVITVLSTERRDMHAQLQEISYRLGAAETRAAQLEAPKSENDAERQSATEPAATPAPAAVAPEPTPEQEKPDAQPVAEANTLAPPRRSFLGRLFG